MTELKDLLTNFRIIDGGYVAFAGDKKGGKITRQGTECNGTLTLEKVNLVPDLCYNLMSVSQVCDKQLSVRFNKVECLFLKPGVIVPEDLVLLRTPRRNNTYIFDTNYPETKPLGLACCQKLLILGHCYSNVDLSM
ncbi:hypothetical protein L1987_20283 [Smallanthus sonchifolius]|uniref:Uncharacterized protein n=1 Tax=Smallanthus sonchifolius TaxID=185202 RepID=A0ACB9IT83_9ASTR|nr:hypothetical protein L1987_20283 [Smallanthus sonchifolius]